MNVDLRFPLGLLFIVFGVLLTVFGLFTDRATYPEFRSFYPSNDVTC